MKSYQRTVHWVVGFVSIVMVLCACASGSAVKPDSTAGASGDDVISSSESQKRALVKSLAVVDQPGSCTLSFLTGAAPQYTVFKLSDPYRIIVDMPEFSISPQADLGIAENDYIQEVFAEEVKDSDRDYLRLTIALRGDFAYHTVSDAASLSIDIRSKSDSTAARATQPVRRPDVSSDVQPTTRPFAGPAVISSITPHSGPDGMTVEIGSTVPIGTYHAYTLESPNRLVIDMPGARSVLNRSRIAVNNESLQQIRIGGDQRNLRIVLDIASADLPPYQIAKQEKSLLVHFQSPGILTASSAPASAVEPADAALDEDAPAQQAAIDLPAAPGEDDLDGTPHRFIGPAISFDFKDADIKNVLRLIADISGKNMIISENVTGRVTLKLDNIPIDEALELILETNGLGSIVTRNITRIETRERIKTINEEKLLARRSHEEVVEMQIRTFDISYSRAQDMVTFIRALKVLSDRGSITAFRLTNKVTVQDIPENLPRIASLIREQDVPTRQVMIEARVVQSNPSYTKQLGIAWGGTYSTTKDGDPINIGGSGTAGRVVNMPAGIGLGSGAGINLGYIRDNLTLNMQLSALENDDKIKIISNPRVIGLDNQQARIKQGVALPFPVLNENGVTSTQFKDAVLELEVTPKITPANTIAMEVKVTKNQRSVQAGFDGEPGIDIREVETFLLMQSGVTAVIGGIYETTQTVNIRTVPFLGTLPFIGYFFRNESQEEVLTELLMFLTVTILDSPENLVQGIESFSG